MKLSEAITYDLNGNLTNDYYKGLQIGYNVLNRVDNTIVTTGTSQYVNYIYDASGQLIRKQEYNNNVLGTTTDYIGGFVYLTQGTGTAALSYFSRPEGRVLVNGSAFTQQFIITDGQGNARISFQNNGASVAVVKQENSYYGFGLQLLNSPVSLPPKPNKKLYNGGSEWQNDYANGDTNLPDYYQTFNRNYDAAIGRFVQTDPDPESAESMTGYQYAGNMPVMLNDPDGDLAMPGSHTPPANNWQVANWFGAQVPGDVQAQQAAFLGGGTGGGLYNTDPDAYWNLYYSGGVAAMGTNIYHAGNRTTQDPTTGSLAQAITLINSVNVANGGASIINANTFWVYFDQNGDPLYQAAGMGSGGTHYFSTTQSLLDGNLINTVAGEIADQGWVHLASNAVTVTFDPGADQLVDPRLEAYFSTLMKAAHDEIATNSVNISSTTNHPTNKLKSAHTYGRAFDINYINGVHVSINDSNTWDLQFVIKETPGWLEDYGPTDVQRIVNYESVYWPYVLRQHQNHIHVSIPQ